MSSHTLLLIDCSGQEVRVLIQGDPTVKEGGRVALERAFFAETDAHLLCAFGRLDDDEI